MRCSSWLVKALAHSTLDAAAVPGAVLAQRVKDWSSSSGAAVGRIQPLVNHTANNARTRIRSRLRWFARWPGGPHGHGRSRREADRRRSTLAGWLQPPLSPRPHQLLLYATHRLVQGRQPCQGARARLHAAADAMKPEGFTLRTRVHTWSDTAWLALTAARGNPWPCSADDEERRWSGRAGRRAAPPRRTWTRLTAVFLPGRPPPGQPSLGQEMRLVHAASMATTPPVYAGGAHPNATRASTPVQEHHHVEHEYLARGDSDAPARDRRGEAS